MRPECVKPVDVSRPAMRSEYAIKKKRERKTGALGQLAIYVYVRPVYVYARLRQGRIDLSMPGSPRKVS